VENMYNNMTENLGRGACLEYVNGRNVDPDEEENVSADSIMKALDLCLRNNFFKFNEKLYQQRGGVGTGIKLAPTYACLGMGNFEKLVFSSNQDLLERILLWKRFIDDVFLLFRGSKEECVELVEWLNSLMPGVVKFKYEYSDVKIEFLDLQIFIENGKLETSLYVKPSNLQLYLDFFSNHPQPCKEAIVYGQALRIIERCSKPGDVDANLGNLKEKLKNRNYPEDLINKKFRQAKLKDRKKIISEGRPNRRRSDDKIRLIFTRNEGNPPIHQWLRECKTLLKKNEKAKLVWRQIGDWSQTTKKSKEESYRS
jgi:hypothetical protein